MGEKIFRTGIYQQRDELYFVRDGDVWARPRTTVDGTRGPDRQVTAIGFTMEPERYLYVVDRDGDIAREPREEAPAEATDAAPPAPPAAAPTDAAAIAPEPLADGASGKLYRVGLRRDNDLMYYIKDGDIWAVPRKKPDEPKGHPVKFTSIGFKMDYGRFLYFLDSDGDIARKLRQG